MENKSIERLMAKRYEVIADYPMAFYSLGQIIETVNPESCHAVEGEYWAVDLTKYPHLFKNNPLNPQYKK